MSSRDAAPAMNETIVRLMSNYLGESKRQRQRIFGFDTPSKRSASPTSSTDDSEVTSASMGSVKRFKPNTDIVNPGTPRDFRKLKCDLLESHNQGKELENQLQHARALHKEEQINNERKAKKWTCQVERDAKTIEQLEAQVASFRKQAISYKTEFNEIKAQFANYKNESEVQIQDLECQLNNLKEDHHDHSIDENTAKTKLERRNEELEMIYKAAKEEAESYKKFVDDLTQKLTEKTNIENELEIKSQALVRAQQLIKKMEFNKDSYQEFQQQAKSQQQKLSNYESIERENHQLREENRNLKNDVHSKLILEEEVHDLKGRLQKYKEQEKKLNNIMISNAQAEMYLEEFRTLARNICEVSNADPSLPRRLRSVVERLQQQELTLTTEKIQLDSALSTASHEGTIAKDELEKCRAHILNLDKDMKQVKTQMLRMQRKIQLISGERDSYRKQLDSYEKDLTICINPASMATPGMGQMQAQSECIKSLEQAVEGYRELVEKLEADLKTMEGPSCIDKVPIRAERDARLSSEYAKLKNDNEFLRKRVDKLEIQLEEYFIGKDIAVGRIVHNSRNPLAELMKQRENEKDRLEEEVVALKRKVKKLEDGLEASRLGDITIDHKEVQLLKEKITSLENNIIRLKEYFKSSMQEFRNVVYMLFGYKIDKSQNSQYKLTSMYADSTEDQLCFQLSKEGAFNLLENQYSAGLETMVELHLVHQRSIPVFLSSLTLDLFNNKTMTKAYEIDDDDDDEEDDNGNDNENEDEDDDNEVEEVASDEDE